MNQFKFMIIAFAIFVTETQGNEDCPQNGLKVNQTCYLVVERYLSIGAKHACEEVGYSHLAYIENHHIYNRVVEYLRENVRSKGLKLLSFWIGRTYIAETDTVQFHDGRLADWNNWMPHYPITTMLADNPVSTNERKIVFWAVQSDADAKFQGFWNEYSDPFPNLPLCQMPA